MTPPSWGGVFFDLDGTLADTVELILMSYRHTMHTHLGEIPPDARWLATIGTPLPIQLAGFARDEAERLAMLETYKTYQGTIHDDMARPFPGVLEALRALRSRGSRLAIVTSKGRSIARRTLRVCGLSSLVDCVVAGDDVERGKPDPAPVLRALEQLRLHDRADEVLFVGDAPVDVRAGRAAGTRTAAVGWGPHPRAHLELEEPDYFLESMEDLLSLER